MPITLLDFILIGVMLVSALLAMIRGFMREVLSIAAWAIAAVATLYAYAKLLPHAKAYFNNDYVAAGVVIGGTFLLTLIVVSIITVRFSDMVLDSRVGALDRTLGFLFGLGRGLIIVVVAFLFFAWLVPPRTQPNWVANAKSKVVLQSTGDWLMSMLPDDPENTILKRLKRPRGDEGEPQDAPPERRGNRDGTGAVDLTFASLSPPVRYANVKSNTAPAINELLVFLWLEHSQKGEPQWDANVRAGTLAMRQLATAESTMPAPTN